MLDTLLADKGKVGYLLPDRPLFPVQGRNSHDYRRSFRDDRDRRRRKGHNIQPDPDHQAQVSPLLRLELLARQPTLTVEPAGIEPATSCLQSRRSPS